MFKNMDGHFGIKFLTSISTIFWAFTLIRAACPDNVLQGGNLLYVLSEDQLDSVAAKNQCAAMGGELAHFQESSSSDIKSKLNALYQTTELTTVKVYVYFNNFKYVPGWFDGYGNPDNSFPNFKLYRNSRPEYNATFVFCKADLRYFSCCGSFWQKWSVESTSCINGWTHDFTLYGGEKDRGTKPVYRYHNSAYSVRLSLSDEPSTLKLSSTIYYDTRLSPLYIPDLRVQTGIQSDVNQSDWLSDNQVVNSFPFHLPPANKDKCQQLALRYNDVDWVASAVECGSTTSYYYMCQIKFTIQAEPITCNGTSIVVSWNPDFYKTVFPKETRTVVRVHVADGRYNEILLSQGQIIFSNLNPRTRYRIYAYVWPCGTAIRSDDVYVTTGYGKPDAIATAYVASQMETDNCVIEWSHDYKDGNITSFEIVANNHFNSSIKLNVTSSLFEIGSSDNRSTRYTIPSELLVIYGYNKNISFQIIAYSCEGASTPMSVNGSCVVVPDEVPPTASPRVEISVVVLPVVALCSLFTIVVLVAYRKRQQRRTSKNGEVFMNAEATSVQTSNSISPTMMNGAERASEKVVQPVHKETLEGKVHLEETSVYENFASNNHKDRLHVNELEHFYVKSAANGFLSIRDEFKTVKKRSANKPHEVAKLEGNKKKNRYKNIYPFDDSRVLLKNSDDYINASYIEGYLGKKTYIATQGAKDCTIADFWQMIWEQNSSVIVMLCKLRELSKVKCSSYWPVQGSTVTHGNFTIKTTFEDDLGWVITRRFYVTISQRSREIFHLQLVSWPDHGVPTATSPLIYLRQMVKEATVDEPNHPVIIHCSAGAGRTGTFIAMDILFDELDHTSVVDVPGAVIRMRERRVDMVQTEDQYVLVYKLLVEHAVYKDTDISAPDYLDLSRQSEWTYRIENEFQLFSRFEKIIPLIEQDRKLNAVGDTKQMASSKDLSTSLNATNLERISPFLGNIIAAKGPAYESETQFWNFVIDENATVLISLDTLEADAVIRSKQGTRFQVSNSDKIFSVDKVQKSEGLVERNITLTTAQTEMKLVHLQPEIWLGKGASPDGTNLLNAINRLQFLVKTNTNVTVYCRDGCTRTGTFIALVNLVERLKSENRIDVFRTIKDLRDMRPNMVNNLDLYKFCYNFMENYLNDFQTYGNFQ
ncbi:unnamed protein product [Clavelina lepadiformis]|uniref:protein-tyrosine-phosphatase n=1 Tax=Clavelina lepadiformis TaxID=159417 RepID=A0ABP0F8H2_CLALP